MMRSTTPLRISAVLLFAMGTSALAGPADDLSRAAVGALPGLQMGGAAVGEARDEGGNAVLVNVTFSSTGATPSGDDHRRAGRRRGPRQCPRPPRGRGRHRR